MVLTPAAKLSGKLILNRTTVIAVEFVEQLWFMGVVRAIGLSGIS
jgi:hypothetical protein